MYLNKEKQGTTTIVDNDTIVAISATGVLKMATDCIGDRAAERDQDEERSMNRCVALFNAYSGRDLTETEGWMFMVCLKMARSKQGEFKLDDYVDGAAYFALAAESVKNV